MCWEQEEGCQLWSAEAKTQHRHPTRFNHKTWFKSHMFFSVWGGLSYIWLQEPHKYLHAVSRHVGQLSKTQIHSSTGCINYSWDCVSNVAQMLVSKNMCTWHKHELEMQFRACDLAQKKHVHTLFQYVCRVKRGVAAFLLYAVKFCDIFFFFLNSCVPMSLWLNSVSLSSLGKGQFSLRQRTRNSAEPWGRVAETRHDMEYSADQTSCRRTWIEQSTRTDWTAGLTWQSPAETGIILTAWHVSGLI